MRKGWYICRSEDSDYHRVKIVTDYNMASTSWLRRCSFALRPLAANEDPLMNCLGTRPPPTPHQKPGISATPTSPPPGTNKTIPTTHSTNATTPTTPPKEEGEKSRRFSCFPQNCPPSVLSIDHSGVGHLRQSLVVLTISPFFIIFWKNWNGQRDES